MAVLTKKTHRLTFVKKFTNPDLVSIGPNDWGRFDFYAKHVKELTILLKGLDVLFRDQSTNFVDLKSFQVFTQQAIESHTTALMPNLRSLVIQSDFHHVDALLPFLSPTLTYLDIFLAVTSLSTLRWPKTYKSLANALSGVLRTCSSLEHLCIAWHFPWLNSRKRDRVLIAISPYIPQLKTLHTLNICNLPITPSFLSLLTELPMLRVLEVDVASYPLHHNHTELSFPSLEEFTTDSYHFAGHTFPLHILCSPVLRVLRAKSLISPAVSQMEEFFTALLLHDSVLQVVEIAWLGGSREEEEEETPPLQFLDCSTFQPLLKCRKLKELRLNALCNYSNVDDSFVEMIRDAWPDLEVLDIGMHNGVASQPSITLHGLENLVAHCRSLKDIGIGNRFLKEVKQLDAHTPRSISTSVTHLRIGCKVSDMSLFACQYTPEAAQYITRLLPNLKSLIYGDGMLSWFGLGTEYRDIETEYEDTLPSSKRWDHIHFHRYEPFDTNNDGPSSADGTEREEDDD